MKRWTLHAGAITLLALAAAGCAGTRMTNMWREPSYNGGTLKKVMVIGLSPQPTGRRNYEDYFVASLQKHGVEGIPSYAHFPAQEKVDEQTLRAKLAELGCDGAVLTHIIGVDKSTEYVPGYVSSYPYGGYGSFYGMYSYGYGAVYSPGYTVENTTVNLETRLFSTVGDGKLLWSGTSETFNPDSPAQVIREVVDTVMSELKRTKFI